MKSRKVPFDPAVPEGVQIEISVKNGEWIPRIVGPCSAHYDAVKLPVWPTDTRTAQTVVDYVRGLMRQDRNRRDALAKQLKELV